MEQAVQRRDFGGEGAWHALDLILAILLQRWRPAISRYFVVPGGKKSEGLNLGQ